ncbi:MAG: arginine repressor [Acidimicrobiia bacterium]|nr:arginine repressor [Acidimicrobiia bacterium]
MTSGNVGKRQRQHLIERLLSNEVVSSQDQLVELLAARGVSATQATVSRDLDDLGAVKVRVGGGAGVYAVPFPAEERSMSAEHLRRVLGDWVVEAAHSGNLVCLRTPPGSAHVVGSALDRAGLPDVLATVAGDDTLLVVARQGNDAGALAGRLRALAGLPPESPPAPTSDAAEES